MDVNVKVVLGTEEIIRGLKHYRRIARQDLLRSAEADNPEAFRKHAEARRVVYAELTEIAEEGTPAAVVEAALQRYQKLPFVTGTVDDAFTEIKGEENV